MLKRILYLLKGLIKQLYWLKKCPCCFGKGTQVDRKFCYILMCCQNCGVMYRYPGETRKRMVKFYQESYKQRGLTTDLSDDAELTELLGINFKETSKDFSRFIQIIKGLNIPRNAKILDYGANWGYAVSQLKKEGYDAIGFEISKSRAEFGRKLGVNIATSLDEIETGYDIVISCHVLEHTHNPCDILKEQAKLIKSGGYLIGAVPNGEESRMRYDFNAYHKSWGEVHPFLLTKKMLDWAFPKNRKIISTRLEDLSMIKGSKPTIDTLSGPELFFIISIG